MQLDQKSMNLNLESSSRSIIKSNDFKNRKKEDVNSFFFSLVSHVF